MAAYPADRNAVRFPWRGILAVAVLLVAVACFIIYVARPWANRYDARSSARAALHDQQTVAVLHKDGFVNVSSRDFYESSYYDGPTAFMYHLGPAATGCEVEIIMSGSGVYTQPYIVLNDVADSTINVTYNSLKHIPQTRACFAR